MGVRNLPPAPTRATTPPPTDAVLVAAAQRVPAAFAPLYARYRDDVLRLATAQLMGAATRRLQVGTWIANIYLRHPYVCAQGAALIADATDGRFMLGLGVSHQPVNAALGLAMPHPLATLRQYVTAVRGWLRGEGPATHLPQRPAPQPVPLYVAALGEQAVELGGELADGIMPLFWSAERVAQSTAWLARGREKAPELGPAQITLGIPTFVGDDLAALRELARQNLVLYTALPFFQRLFRAMGFAEEAARMERGEGMPGLSDRLLDAICLIGPRDRCQERLAAFRAAGVALPILYPPVGLDGARQVVAAFRR
jgi:alkanesulfonate monooxygenase SsuD/methylene tetrahydromethanopterin reductase-like flavin-dependent oxidoreductase (luciferase family)